ncbi:ABC transporter ATP-binding protein [Streptomyces sp. NPDC048445]|uniref:ABC transporter ATP-binding protein n=1 Tax=Streptomyces sp. NPDC048445 TaxID=3365553 RepID=UPI0037180F86
MNSTDAQNTAEDGRTADAEDKLLTARGLTKHFPVTGGPFKPGNRAVVRAVDGVDLDITRGRTLALVGESGCGKSTTARLLARLLEPTAGQVALGGTDITHKSRREMRPFRRQIQMVFQDPYSSLNPRRSIADIVATPLIVNSGVGQPRSEVNRQVRELLELVGLSPAHSSRYPHEFSGGQRQRIGIARALALRPSLLIADEPVSALDVSVQAQIINLLLGLQEELGLTYVIIAHNLSLVRHVADEVAVMYLGKIVETGSRDRIYENPLHPYTQALMSAAPVPVPPADGNRRPRIVLRGDPPSPVDPPSGCRFHTRCWKARDVCRVQEPVLARPAGAAHTVACHFPGKEPGGDSTSA